MSADEIEALLRECRPPVPSGAVERRVVAEARRLRTPPSRLLVLAATLLFGLVVVAVVRSEPPAPGASKDVIRKWTYTCREGGVVVASLSADEAVVENVGLRLRGFTAKLFPSKGEAIPLRADTAKFDPAASLIGVERDVAILGISGFSSGTVDLKRARWTATMDLTAQRAAVPKIRIEAKSGTSWEGGASYEDFAIQLACPGWSLRVSGAQARTDLGITRVTGGVETTFYGGRTLRVEEADLADSERTLFLIGTFK